VEKRYMLLHCPSASLGTGVQDRLQGGGFPADGGNR
jgi:hypothetical protein